MAKKPSAPFREDLPFDIELEQALLGALLVDNNHIDTAVGDIGPEDFYDPLHARLFEIMGALRTEGDVTPLTVFSVMKYDPGLQEMGGTAYLAGLASATPAFPNIRDYTRLLLDGSRRRSIIRIAEEMRDAAYESSASIPTVVMVEQATSDIEAIMGGSRGGVHRRGVPVYEALDGLMREISEQAKADTPISISTGIPRLDGITGGWLPGKLYVLGGRPGMGKTVAATNFARSAAETGAQADYYSGEMDADEIAARLGCDIDFNRCFTEQLEPLAYQDFVNLRAKAGSMHRMAEARSILANLDIDFFDAGRLTIEYIVSNAHRRHRLNNRRRLIIVDHLQKVHWQGKPRDAGRVAEISEITTQLKTLAKDLATPVLALSQLTRDIEAREDKHPRQSDFRDGGSVEENADVLFGVMRPARYAADKIRAAKNEDQRLTATGEAVNAAGVFEIAVLKQRAGPEVDYFSLFIDERASAIRDESPGSMPKRDLFF